MYSTIQNFRLIWPVFQNCLTKEIHSYKYFTEKVCFLSQFGRIVIHPSINEPRENDKDTHSARQFTQVITQRWCCCATSTCHPMLYIPSLRIPSTYVSPTRIHEWPDRPPCLTPALMPLTHSLTRVCIPKATTTSSTRESLTGAGFHWDIQVHFI